MHLLQLVLLMFFRLPFPPPHNKERLACQTMTLREINPPRWMKMQQAADIFLGTCPMTPISRFTIDTAYLSLVFLSSFSQGKISPGIAFQTDLYIRFDQCFMHASKPMITYSSF